MARLARAGAAAIAAGWLVTCTLAAREARAQLDSCAEASAPAWKAVEARGGVVPEIDEDRTQAPPGWWRYPNPRRSAELLAAEARDADGLFARVASADLEAGDVVVRAQGAGACGKMGVLAGKLEDRWVVQDAADKEEEARTSGEAFFLDGAHLRPEVTAYRVRVKSDSSQGHVRELGRDLAHLERTIAERPALIAKGGREVLDVKVHELVDEAWSLMADPAFDLSRRELGGRALALAAALDWPGAAESAAAVLDDVLVRAPQRADAAVARASVFLLEGQPERALTLAEAAAALPHAPARARYVMGRALLATGKDAAGLAAVRRYLAEEPRDPRASRLAATAGREPRLAPPPPREPALRFAATAEHAGVTSAPYGFHVDWPIPWRLVTESATPDSGLLLDLVTERVLDDEGAPQRGAASLLAQRPESPAARAALVKKAGRTIFPDAKLKTLPPLVPGSRRESFRERGEGGPGAHMGIHTGEITTFEHAGVVYFVVLNAPARAYSKLKDEYATFVKSLTFLPLAPSP
jgi:hypothetical protein